TWPPRSRTRSRCGPSRWPAWRRPRAHTDAGGGRTVRFARNAVVRHFAGRPPATGYGPMRIALALALITAPCTARVAAQTATPTAGPPPAVFLDCEADSCDGTHIRNEIRFVDWMRDRTDADVHVLLTSQSTGGGGESY